MDRRKFLGNVAGLAGGSLLSPLQAHSITNDLYSRIQSQTDKPQLVTDESFWKLVRNAYSVSAEIINLNNGGVSPQPRIVQAAVVKDYSYANELPSYNLWRKIDKDREPIREKLAELAGCAAEEIAINRNATEGLETIIFGLPLERGDEVVLSRYDYPSMVNAWEQRASRDGIILKYVDLDVPMEDTETIVSRYVKVLTSKTRLVHVTHLINWTGQLLPVKEITRAVKEREVEVMIDGAHSFAHLDFSIQEIGCDYFATSLHKWLCAPFGTGFLFVRKEKIAKIFPMFASAAGPNDADIRKFEHLGTRSLGIEMGILEAIEFHNQIGIDLKHARLLYLRQYWSDKLRARPGIRLLTSDKDGYAAGMGLLDIESLEPGKLYNHLFQEKKILTSPVNHLDARGVRISPNIYTQLEELDYFVEAIEEMDRG
ncbi:MAG: aminotransferase class V-fold PLP-dependent enzyme [Bacteroidetes bacterium]|nr:aminotransferase class V-fold PLP-dependent enzyme [Bacteroidota bacterium]